MGGMIGGSKKDPNEHIVPALFNAGPGRLGRLDPGKTQIPKHFQQATKPDGSLAVNGVDWYEIIRALESSFLTGSTAEVRKKIVRRLIVTAVSMVGVVLGFILGFLMSFLGCSSSNWPVCSVGIVFGVIFIVSLFGLFGGFTMANGLMPTYANLVIQDITAQLPQLMSRYPCLKMDLVNVRMAPAPQFGVRFLLDTTGTSRAAAASPAVVVAASGVPREPRAAEIIAEDKPLPAQVPSHWKNTVLTSHFLERCSVSPEESTVLEDVLRSTFVARKTRDRHGDLPSGLKMLTCHRVENSALWATYCERRENLQSKWPQGCMDFLTNGEHPTQTTDKMKPFSDSLEPSVNEYYLWHGTSPNGAVGISEQGFRIDLSGSTTGSMFGPGAYFAECSSKADEYAIEGDGIYVGVYAVLLCRVVCGRMVRQTKPDWPAAKKQLDLGSADSVLGDREASVGTYREFVVYKAESVYPEYVILYSRETA